MPAATSGRPEPGKLWGTSTSGYNSIGGVGSLPAAFPKGYAPFYCMKYAIYKNSNPNGPARVGLFAIPGATRVEAGASYWGIMELSGNVWERTVSVTNGRFFTGMHGDGTLLANGNADAADWPGTNASGAGERGGNWYEAASNARASDRYLAAIVYAKRDLNRGGRAVRSAP